MFGQKSSVTVVAHPETGAIITPSTNKPEWGTIRVDQRVIENNGGILNPKNRSAFVRGKIEVLESFNLTEGQELPGNVVVTESTTPFYEGQTPKINPQNEEVLLDENGNAIYRDTVYDETGEMADTLIKYHSTTPLATFQATAVNTVALQEVEG